MSSLSYVDTQLLESLFEMGSGYVLKFSDRSFADFFQTTAKIDIFSARYERGSNSKANRMRAFWQHDPDAIVAKVLSELLLLWLQQNQNIRTEAFLKCEAIVKRLFGVNASADLESDFLMRRIEVPSLARLPVEAAVIPVLEARLREAEVAHRHGLGLTTVILCGSILEGALLGLAQKNIAAFNQSSSAPKDREGKIKRLHDWKLADFIDVAHEQGHLHLDVKKFSHALRDFRNFIHPYEQMHTGFQPDRHTADICLQVLKAAFASLAGDRKASA